jgi:hypothetical protein
MKKKILRGRLVCLQMLVLREDINAKVKQEDEKPKKKADVNSSSSTYHDRQSIIQLRIREV